MARTKRQPTTDEILSAFDADERDVHTLLRTDPVAFCRHVLGVEPHRKQVEVLKSPLEKQSSMLPWGRGFGKTEVLSWYLSHQLYAQPGYHAYCFAPCGDQSRVLWERVCRHYKVMPYLRRYCDHRIRGNKIIVGGDEWDSSLEYIEVGLTGKGGRSRHTGKGLIVFDELSSFVYPQEVVEVLEPLIATQGGGEVFLSSPGEIDSYMWHQYQDMKEQEALACQQGRTPYHRVYEATWEDTNHLSAEFVAEKRRLAEKQGRLWHFEREYMGAWTKTEGAFFSRDDVKGCHSQSPLPHGGPLDVWVYSLDPGLDRSPAVLLIARWNPTERRLEIAECLSLVRQSNRYVREGDHATIDGYPDLLDLILNLRRERPIYRLYIDPGCERNIGETLRNRFAVNVVDCRIGGYSAKLTALQDLQRALAERRIVWEDGRITAQLLGFAPPVNQQTQRYDFPDRDYDIIAALTQLCRYLGDHTEEPFVIEAIGGRAEW